MLNNIAGPVPVAGNRYYLNQFDCDSEFALPCEPAEMLSEYASQCVPLIYASRNLEKETYQFCHLIGSGRMRNFRTYETDKGLLLTTSENCNLLISDKTDRVDCDITSATSYGKSLFTPLLMNLALALKSLLRGDVPIHCASLCISDKLVGIAADSGTGKSTLLWEIIRRGNFLASDDVLTMRLIGKRLLAAPSRGIPSKVSMATATRMEMSLNGKIECIPGSNEYWIPVSSKTRIIDDRPLRALIILAPDSPNSPRRPHADIFRVKCKDSIVCLIIRHTQGLWGVAPMLEPQRYMQVCRAIAKRTPVFVCQYERSFQALPELVDTIIKLVQCL